MSTMVVPQWGLALGLVLWRQPGLPGPGPGPQVPLTTCYQLRFSLLLNMRKHLRLKDINTGKQIKFHILYVYIYRFQYIFIMYLLVVILLYFGNVSIAHICVILGAVSTHALSLHSLNMLCSTCPPPTSSPASTYHLPHSS